MKDRIYLNNDWDFVPEFNEDAIHPEFNGKTEKIRLPHTVEILPYNNFDESMYQKVCVYRKTFKTDPNWKSKRILLTIEAAGHESEIFVNGVNLGLHRCGYTARTIDITDHLKPEGKENLLAIKVDSRETLNQPPFGFVIDYMTYGGIYREVWLDVKNPVYMEDIFIKTKSNHFETEITLNTDKIPEGYSISQRIQNGDINSAQVETGVPGKKILTAADAVPVIQWSPDNPQLYDLITELKDENGAVVDAKKIRFGFRDIKFDETGFYLNGTRLKLRGLNRHQSWPYTGYAMPKNMQIDDADILKKELGLNYVRTSHYPQSQHFINRCDELGLLVFTEIPGWQHIGNEEWQDIAVNNVKDMIMQYRNHPSIFMWGVRINESLDNDGFYQRTNDLAHQLDSTRPTGGVRYLKNSSFLEDVYTYNDFSFNGPNSGTQDKKDVTPSKKGYLVSEYNGHMFPTKSFDSEAHRTEHARRHAVVLDSVAGHDDCGGSSGWCAFDYNTHKDFGSGDRICYHGVMDMFRNPKMAAAVYKCLGNARDTGDVLEISSSMDIGEYPAGCQGDVYIFTNTDSVKLYVNDIYIKDFKPKDSPFKNLKHGPILIDDYIGNRLTDEEKIPEKYAEIIKELLRASLKYGPDNIPAKIKAKGAPLVSKGIADEARIKELYNKYIGNWGGEKTVYKFEAYRDGKLVKTVIKTACNFAQVQATTTRDTLVEESTYDVTEIYLRAVDENGNVQPYCQEAVMISCEGPIELIGPECVSLKGGMAGCYIKSTGEPGEASVTIKDWYGKTTKVPIKVKVSKKC